MVVSHRISLSLNCVGSKSSNKQLSCYDDKVLTIQYKLVASHDSHREPSLFVLSQKSLLWSMPRDVCGRLLPTLTSYRGTCQLAVKLLTSNFFLFNKSQAKRNLVSLMEHIDFEPSMSVALHLPYITIHYNTKRFLRVKSPDYSPQNDKRFVGQKKKKRKKTKTTKNCYNIIRLEDIFCLFM